MNFWRQIVSHSLRPLMAAMLAAGLAGCAEESSANGPATTRPAREAVQVALAPVQIGTLPVTIDVVGTLYGDEEATISAKVPGRVLEIFADVGDRVAPGAPLAQLDPADYELVVRQREMDLFEALASLGLETMPPDDFDVSNVATVARARFQAANAKARMERARQLYTQDPPLISEQEFTDLETAYQVSERNHDVAVLEARQQIAVAKARESQLGTARQQLADTTVRAPASPAAAQSPNPDRYAITERRVSVGEYVGQGTAMFRVVADDPIKFRAAVPERYAGQVAIGQQATLRIEGSSEGFTGKVARINPAISVETRTFEVEILVENDDHRLKPGAFGRGTIEVGERSGVVFVPREAIVSFAGVDKVYTVADGKAVEHRVTLLRNEGEMVPVNSDLGGATEVVTFGVGRLAKDVPVQVTSEPTPRSAADQSPEHEP